MIVYGVGNIGSKFFQFISVPVYTYYMTTSQYGKTDLISTVVTLLVPLISMSLYNAVLRFVLDNYEDRATYLNAAIIGVVPVILIVSVGSIIEFMAQQNNLIGTVGILLVLQMFNGILAQYAKSINKNLAFAMNGLFQTGIMLLISIILLRINLVSPVVSYFASQAISFLISTSGLIYVCRKDIDLSATKNIFKVLKNMLAYSLPLMPNEIMWWIMNVSDRMLITYFLGLKYNGIYAVAVKVPALINVIATVFMQSWQISAFQSYSSDQKNSYYSKVLNNFFYFLILGVSGILLFLKPIISILASNTFFTAWRYVPILLIGVIFSNLSMFLGTNYLAARKTYGILKTSILGAIVNFLLNILLIPIIGINGAGCATMLSYLVVCLVRIKGTRNFVNIKFDKKLILLGFVGISTQIFSLYFNLFILNFVVVCLLIFSFKRYLSEPFVNVLKFIKETKNKL